MTRSVAGKLILAFLLVAITSVVILAVAIPLTTARRFNTLVFDQQQVALESILIDYYQANGDLVGFERHLNAFAPVQRGPMTGNDQRGINRRNPFAVVDSDSRVIVPLPPELRMGMIVQPNILENGYPVMLDDERIATILLPRIAPELTLQERAFLAGTNQALFLAALGALLVALVVGVLLAQRLTRPLRALTEAVEGMADGATPAEVQVTSQDELGELARAFNQMNQRVTKANALRRQMTADIAHDLRTPLTVIAGYIESMQEGVLEADPQRLAVIYSEISQLQRLVEDLMTLSRADAGELRLNLQLLSVSGLLEHTAASFAEQARKNQISITCHSADDLPDVMMDEARMLQVLGNLVTNSLRFTPPGGEIAMEATSKGGEVQISVRDTGKGIAPEDLPRIFERLYRADASRSQEGGESGLGLAISRAIVQLHGGRIWTESKLGAGTTITLRLPVQ